MAKTPRMSVVMDKFALLLAQGMTQAEAYKATHPKCHARNAGSQGVKMASHPYVKERRAFYRDIIAEKIAEKVAEREAMTAMAVLGEISAIARSRAADVIDEHGRLKGSLDDLTDDQRASIAGIETTPTKFGDKVVVKFHNKLTALDMMAKHLRLYGQDAVQDRPVNVNITLRQDDK